MDTHTQFPSIPCPACSTLLPPKARFCGKCGQALDPQTDRQASSVAPGEAVLRVQEQSDTSQEVPSTTSSRHMQEQEARQKQLFVSYSRQQFYFAESLALGLQRCSVPIWFDVQRLVPGSDWQQSLLEGLDTCAGLVLVASRAALASPYVRREWQAALQTGKPIYVVLSEAVRLPPELTNAAIIDFRSNFDHALALLIQSIQTGTLHRDRLPPANPLRLPTRLPWSLGLVLSALWGNVLAFAVFIILTMRLFPSMTILGPQGGELVLGFSLACLGAMAYFCYYALVFTYRKGFISYQEIRMMLLAGPLMLASFYIGIFSETLDRAAHHAMDWVGLSLSVAPDADRLGTLFLLIMLFSFVLGGIAFFVIPRSSAIVRWLPTGMAPEKLRTQERSLQYIGLRWKERVSKKTKTYQLHYDPSDERIASEVRQAFWGEGRLQERTSGQADIHLVIVTNKTPQAWVNELGQTLSNIVYIVASSIRIPKDEMSLRRFQWVDYRLRSKRQLEQMRVLLFEDPVATGEYMYPAVPESLEKLVFPFSMVWISNALSLMGTYAFGVGVAALILMLQRGPHQTPLGVLPVVGVGVGFFLFWLNDRLKAWNITYIGFIAALVIGLVGFFLSKTLPILYPTNGIAMQIVLLIVLLIVLAFTHQTLRDWLPKKGHRLFKRWQPDLHAPTWKQLWRNRFFFMLITAEIAIFALALYTPYAPAVP